jgi:hypothetical protein
VQHDEAETAKLAPREKGGGFCWLPRGKLIGALAKEGELCVLDEYNCELGYQCRGPLDGAPCQAYDGSCHANLNCRSGACESGQCLGLCYGEPTNFTLLGGHW